MNTQRTIKITDHYPELEKAISSLPDHKQRVVNNFYSKIANSEEDLEALMYIISLALKSTTNQR